MSPKEQLENLRSQLATQFIEDNVVPFLKANKLNLRWSMGCVFIVDESGKELSSSRFDKARIKFSDIEHLAEKEFRGFYETKYNVFWTLLLSYNGKKDNTKEGSFLDLSE